MERREALTIRLPAQLLARARESKTDSESFNDFVVTAIEKEVRRRQALQTHARIVAINERIRSRSGVQPDSAPLIRELREGIGRRD